MAGIPFITIELDKVYKLRFGMSAMVQFEQLTGIKLMEIGENMSVEIVAKLLWVMLQQEDKEMTLEKTCELVDEFAEDINVVMEKVTKALEVAFQGKGGEKNA